MKLLRFFRWRRNLLRPTGEWLDLKKMQNAMIHNTKNKRILARKKPTEMLLNDGQILFRAITINHVYGDSCFAESTRPSDSVKVSVAVRSLHVVQR